MTPCTATVTVAGIGTYPCEITHPCQSTIEGHEIHAATLPSDSPWASVSWTGDTATIRGTRRTS